MSKDFLDHRLHQVSQRRFLNRKHLSATSAAQAVEATPDSSGENTIAELKRRLAESEARFDQIFHSSPVGISISRLADGVILDSNDAALKNVGLPRDKVIGFSARSFASWGTSEDRARVGRDLAEHGHVAGFEMPFISGAGEPRVGMIALDLVEVDGEKCILTQLLDVTDSKRVELALQQTESHLSLIFNNTSDMQVLYAVEPSGKMVAQTVNEAYLNLVRFLVPDLMASDVVGKTREQCLTDLLGFAPDLFVEETAAIASVIRSGARIEREQRVDVSFGTFYLLVRLIPVMSPEGVCRYLLWSAQDITQRKLTEMAFARKQEEERQHQEALKTLHEVSIELTHSENLDDFCRRAVELGLVLGFDRIAFWRYDAERNLAMGTYGTDTEGKLHPEGDLQFVVEPDGGMWESLKGPSPLVYKEAVRLAHNLETVGIGWNVVVALWHRSQVIGFLTVDNLLHHRPITQPQLDILSQYGMILAAALARLQTYQALQQSESRYRALIESQIDLISRYKPDMTLTFVNDAYCKFYGRTREQLVGQSCLPMIAEEFHPTVLEEARRMTLDPTPQSGEYLNFAADGSEHWIHWVIQGIRDSDGIVSEIQAVGRDITALKKAEAALRDSEFFLQRSQSVGQVGSYYFDVASGTWLSSLMLDKILGINGSFSRDIESFLTLIHPEDREAMRRDFAHHLLGEYNRFENTYRILRQDNHEERWVYGLGEVETSTHGKVTKIIGTIQDITDRKRMEDALRLSQKRYLRLSQNLPDMAAVLIDENMQVLVAEGAELTRAGYPAEDILGKRVGEILPVGQDGGVLKEVRAAFDGETVHLEVRSPGDVSQTYQVVFAPVPDSNGVIINVLALLQNITDRKRMEDALRESEARYRLIVETAVEGIWLIDRGAITTYVNPMMASMLGYSVDEMLGRSLYDFMDDAGRMDAQRNLERRSQGIRETHDFRFRHKSGSDVWTNVATNPIMDEQGTFVAALAMVTDITERRQTQAALLQSEERLRQAVRVGRIGIFDDDQINGVIYWSPELRKIHGFPPDQVADLTMFIKHLYPDDRERVAEAIQRAHDPSGDGIFDVEHRIIDVNGRVHWVVNRSQTFFETIDGVRRPVRTVGAASDVTERKQMEEALRLSEMRLNGAQKIAHVGDWDWDLATNSLYWSEETYHIFGCEPGDFELNVEAFAERVHPEDRDLVQLAVASALEKKFYDVEHRILLPDGQTRHVRQRGEITLNAMGMPVRMFGTTQDITEWKFVEESIRMLNESLERRVQERTAELEAANEEIRNFAYIVSHDLRAPLVNLKGFSTELRLAVDSLWAGCEEAMPHVSAPKREAVERSLKEDIPEALRFVETSVSQMDNFTKAMLKLSRLGHRELDVVQVDVGRLVGKTLAMLAYQITQRGITITTGNLPPVIADLVSMEQIFGNIISNAILYLDPNRPGRVEISGHANAQETTYVIRDNGRGIASGDMDKVFAPFRRLGRQDVPGEGMGLAYVQTLVRRHGGRIWCESEVGVGTTFTFTISNNLAAAEEA